MRVEQVVSRIGGGRGGAAGDPTDPMSFLEMSDIIIKLKDPDDWSRVDSKTALANLMTEELSVLPGIILPVYPAHRNALQTKLLTGVQSDLAH